MPKYRVYMDQIVQYHVDIVANSEEEAESLIEGYEGGDKVEYNRLKLEVREDLTEKI